jgi:hypothetical protein
MTIDFVVGFVKEADEAFDAIADVVGVGEFKPLADALTALLGKVQGAIEKGGTVLSAEVAAVDAEVEGAADAKFGPRR